MTSSRTVILPTVSRDISYETAKALLPSPNAHHALLSALSLSSSNKSLSEANSRLNAKETVKTSRDGVNVFIDNTGTCALFPCPSSSLTYQSHIHYDGGISLRAPLTPHLRHQPLDAHITIFHLIPLLPLAGLLHLTSVATGGLTGKRVLFDTAVYRCSKTALSMLHAQLPPKAARRRHQSISSVDSGFCVTGLGNHDEEAM
ncbi:hypothetical protein MY1884_003378 [Beauveria asiatica]